MLRYDISVTFIVAEVRLKRIVNTFITFSVYGVFFTRFSPQSSLLFRICVFRCTIFPILSWVGSFVLSNVCCVKYHRLNLGLWCMFIVTVVTSHFWHFAIKRFNFFIKIALYMKEIQSHRCSQLFFLYPVQDDMQCDWYEMVSQNLYQSITSFAKPLLQTDVSEAMWRMLIH